jgi:phage I-like protein
MTASTITTLASLTGETPPSEFRIFRAGKNETTKGTFLFDAKAAQLVMAEYRAHGADLMLDYDHASLGVGIDPALSGKAAGWFELAVRNGELWAVNVRWTPAAAAALRQKEWRYMSPAFGLDKTTNRITSLLNVALTNMPATRQLDPLMAASARDPLEAAALASLTSSQRKILRETPGATASGFIAARRALGGWR